MAPPPEYDKEPKAPDKSVTSSTADDSKVASHDQQNNSDSKPANAAANVETEDNKHVEALDDGQLRALLDEAITYKCPKDREGKSSLFKELLEGVEQEEQACEAAARTWGANTSRTRGVRCSGGRSRRALPHSNSLQDLVAALAADPVPRRRQHQHPPPQVSARTHHGGSLPSGVDTSFLLGEDSGRSSMPRSGAVEYVATVHCENPSPLTERRVSASDAPGAENEPNRRSKVGAFPMTYTARATLEIGSGSVGAGRAVTTTTASNQVRTSRTNPELLARKPELAAETPELTPNQKQLKLLSALCPKGRGGGTDRSLSRGPDVSVRDKKRRNNKKKVAADLPFCSPENVKSKDIASAENIRPQNVTILKRVCSDQQKILNGSKKPSKVAPSSLGLIDQEAGTPLTQNPLPQRPQSKASARKLNEATSPGDVTLQKVSDIKEPHKVALFKSGSIELDSTALLTQHPLPQRPQRKAMTKKHNEATSLSDVNLQKVSDIKEPHKVELFKSESIEQDSTALLTQHPLPQRPQRKAITKKRNEATSPVDVTPQKESENVVLLKRSSTESPDRNKCSKETVEVTDVLPFNTLFPSYYNTSNPYLKSCLGNIATAYVSTAEIPKMADKIDASPVSSELNTNNISARQIKQSGKQSGKKQVAPPANKITKNVPTVHEKNVNPINKKHEEPPTSRVPKPPTTNKTIENAAPKPSSNNPKVENNSQPKKLDMQSKTKQDGFCTMPFKSLFPNYYNNSYLSSLTSNSNEINAQPESSNRYHHIQVPLHIPSINNYNQDDYNRLEPQTDGPTHGPPEALFPKGTAKSRKPSQKNNFLRQYYTNNAYKTNSIIYPQNSDASSSYTVGPFSEGPTYSSHGRNRERNNNNAEVHKAKPGKGHFGQTNRESKPEMGETDNAENRSPIRNVRPMTIAKRVTAASTHDASSVTDNRVIDKNNDGYCKSSSGTSDRAIADNTDTCKDNARTQIKDDASMREEKKDDAKFKKQIATTNEKTSRKEKKVSDSTDKVVVLKNVTFDIPKNEIGDSTKTEVKGNVIKNICNEDATSGVENIAIIKKPTSYEEDDVKCTEIKSVKNQNKILVVDDDGSIELVDMARNTRKQRLDKQTSNLDYFTEQERFFQSLETFEPNETRCDSNEQSSDCDKVDAPNKSSNDVTETHSKPYQDMDEIQVENIDTNVHTQSRALSVIDMNKGNATESGYSEHYIIAELSNNAYVFLTAPNSLLSSFQSTSLTHKLREITSGVADVSKTDKKPKKKRNQAKKEESRVENKAVNLSSDKAVLRKLLFEKLLRDGVTENRLTTPGASKKVDSGIPFSCITTPEVVASCNTTSSSPQSSTALDTKPRSSASAGFNGLPLTRPNYGATGSVDEYKKSLDENGNSVQGFSSPLAGSSSHNKKPRRKKSSKNETVIKSHQIDGYQGNKDLNEVLRFIESTEEQRKKLSRVPKHKEDDDKSKKRSTERRKDKDRAPRASSLEERSRTSLAELTGRPKKPRAPRAAARRSWGDDARHDYYYEEPDATQTPPAPPKTDKPDKKRAKPTKADAPEPHSDTALELMDFQTVTKKKKQRKRFEDGSGAGHEPFRKPVSPERRRKSAPPSDKSNDSNDDMDSVHSLPADAARPTPAPAAAPAPTISYADIARTRHNIPDLIESCNFYADEVEQPPRQPPREPAAPLAYDADSYPALEARLPRRVRDKPRPAVKEPPPEPEEPPPDVVADRRPPVILLDEAARPRDMDGITFGFDINEQLLGDDTACGATRRCDLLREALEGATVVSQDGCLTSQDGDLTAQEDGVCVRVGLRYVPPAPPPPHRAAALHKIVDYVGHAWEDIIKCGAGKVRYFSE